MWIGLSSILAFSGILAAVSTMIVFFAYYWWAERVVSCKAPHRAKRIVAVIVATRNEEEVIKVKLQDLFAQTYPPENMRIFIIDDASTDGTLEMARSIQRNHAGRNITILGLKDRAGKSHVVNKALALLPPECEIVVFTDADVKLAVDAIERLVARFSEGEIGGVSGRQVLVNRDQNVLTEMEDTYRRIYRKLRIAESNTDSTPIFHGELAAFRASVVRDEKIAEDANADDSALAFTVRRKGFRAVYDEDVLFYESAPPDRASQRAQKIRRAQGLIRVFWRNKDMLLRWKYGDFGRWIFPMNFTMHIITPPLVMLSISFFVASIIALNLEGRILEFALMSLAVAAMLAVVRHRSQLNPILIAITFVQYQLFLLHALLLAVFRVKLYRWDPVQSVRKRRVSYTRVSNCP